MTTSKPKKPRKKSKRAKGEPRATSATSARLKELWTTPEFRERMKQRDQDRIAAAKLNPAAFNRSGIPDGMKRAEAEQLWAKADELADIFIAKLKKTGELPDEVYETLWSSGIEVPLGDDAMAEAALRQAFVLAVGPSSPQIKCQAINTVLTYTMARPKGREKLVMGEITAFLDAIVNNYD